MKLKYLCLLISLFSLGTLSAQVKPENMPFPAQTDSLQAYEKKLKAIGDSMVDAKFQYTRIKALTQYIPTLVQALKFRGSYDYPFADLTFMQKLEPEDHSFRLYSWLLKYDDGTFRYYGAIQFPGEKLKLIPLRDYSEKLDSAVQELVLDKDTWFGAFYYNIFTSEIKGKKYYILFGFDGNTSGSNKKLIEVLSFDDKNQPVLGAPIFEKDGKTLSRVIFEFNEEATMLLNYIPDQNLITLDHLVPPNPDSEGFYFTYIPDGTYDYFLFKNGKWIFQNKELFKKYKIKEAGNTPVVDEKKKSLEEQKDINSGRSRKKK